MVITEINEEEKLTNLKNDIFIHHLFSDPQDPKKRPFFKIIIEDILHLEFDEIVVLTPKLTSSTYLQKDMTVDIRAKLKDGPYINIEMQQSASLSIHFDRFNAYGFQMVTDQYKIGKPYSETEKVYQIIITNTTNIPDDFMIDWWEIHNRKGNTRDDFPIIQVVFYIQYINKILEEKTLDLLDHTELFAYLLDKGVTHDILALEEKEVVENMSDILDEFNEDKDLRLMALSRELELQAIEEDMANERASGHEEGISIGELKATKSKVIQLFNAFYPNEETTFLNDLTIQQYDLIFDALLKHQSVEELKALIK